MAYQNRLKSDDLEAMVKANVYQNRESLPNNFFKTIPDKALAMQTLQMFKDSYILDYINVEEIDVSDPMDIDEKVIESKIVMNIKITSNRWAWRRTLPPTTWAKNLKNSCRPSRSWKRLLVRDSGGGEPYVIYDEDF